MCICLRRENKILPGQWDWKCFLEKCEAYSQNERNWNWKKISGWINKYNVIIIWPSNPSSGAFKLKKTQVKMQERTRTRYLNYCQGNERGHKGQDNICVFSFACLHVCLSAYLSIYFCQLIYSFASMFFYFFLPAFFACLSVKLFTFVCLYVSITLHFRFSVFCLSM